jgi:hypothetical protein
MPINQELEECFYTAIADKNYLKECDTYIREQKDIWIGQKRQKNPAATNIIYKRVCENYQKWKTEKNSTK